jgi:hypothetical protein
VDGRELNGSGLARIVETLRPQLRTIVGPARSPAIVAQSSVRPAIREPAPLEIGLEGKALIASLSFRHIAGLLALDD